VTRQWDKTDIPHTLKGKDGVRKVVTLLTKCKELKKEKWRVRGEVKVFVGEEVKHLFDMSVCHHTSQSICDCAPDNKVPPNWQDYLTDQRGPRSSKALISGRAMSLCCGIRDMTEEEKDQVVKSAKKVDDTINKEKRLENRKRKAQDKVEDMFRKVKIENKSDNDVADSDERDWEEVEEKSRQKDKEYNTMSLRNLARKADRGNVSDQVAANIANGLLMDSWNSETWQD
jgi:hypothetical protein